MLHTYIHACMHACMHACIHAYMHTRIHAYIHTYVRTYIQTDRQTYIHTYIQTYRHTDIQTYRHTDIQTYRHTDIETYRDTVIQTYRHTDIQTYTHTNIHTHIHTYTHTHIHTHRHRHRHTHTHMHAHTHTHTHTRTRTHTHKNANTKHTSPSQSCVAPPLHTFLALVATLPIPLHPFHARIFHAQLCHAQLLHTPPSLSRFCHPIFTFLLLLIGRNRHVGLSGPLIVVFLSNITILWDTPKDLIDFLHVNDFFGDNVNEPRLGHFGRKEQAGSLPGSFQFLPCLIEGGEAPLEILTKKTQIDNQRMNNNICEPPPEFQHRTGRNQFQRLQTLVSNHSF